MDSLARSGVFFREAFVAFPVCAASKAAIYTGVHNHMTGMVGNTMNIFKRAAEMTEFERTQNATRMQIADRFPTLIEELHEANYYTGITRGLQVLPLEKFPFDEFIPKRVEDPVSGFIERANATGRPWFLMHSIAPPHRPFAPLKKARFPVEPAAVEVPGFLPNTPVVRRDWAEYLAAVQLADAVVGEALRALRDSGQEENTIVVFLGDHGPAFQRGKASVHDFGLRVPLAIRGPGIREGGVSDALVSELDLRPTILDLLGLRPPELTHGVSLRPILSGATQAETRSYVFAENENRIPTVEDGMHERSVYDGRFHLIYRENLDRPRIVNADLRKSETWRNKTYAETVRRRREFPEPYQLLTQLDPVRLAGKPPKLELFDLKEDPDELVNLADDPKHRNDLSRLLAALTRWADDTDDEHLSLGPELIPYVEEKR